MNKLYQEIINPSIYSNNSLKKDIEEICEPNAVVTNEQIINIIIKYFFAYKYPETININLPLDDINIMFWITHDYFELLEKKPNTDIAINSQEIIEMFNFIQTSWYPLVMLWDISSTTSIVKSIINVIINPEVYQKQYVWLDLWSGTGILLLAQYIQARRNGFTDIENIWIEIKEDSAKHSNLLINKIWAWKVLAWDTTKNKTFEWLFWNKILTHISNETIATNGISMTWINDPFHQNNETLYSALETNISANTHFFPAQIEMILRLWDDKRVIQWNPNNKFALWPLLEIEKLMLETDSISFPVNWRIFNQLNANSIQIGNKMIKLNEIWDHLKNHWMVKPLEFWMKRWT